MIKNMKGMLRTAPPSTATNEPTTSLSTPSKPLPTALLPALMTTPLQTPVFAKLTTNSSQSTETTKDKEEHTHKHTEIEKELHDCNKNLSTLSLHLKSINFINPIVYVDALSFCFYFGNLLNNNGHQIIQESIEFVKKYIFQTSMTNEVTLNSFMKDKNDKEGGLFSIKKNNSYVIEEMMKKEFVICFKPWTLVIHEENAEEFIMALKQNIVGLPINNNYKTSKAIAKYCYKDINVHTSVILEILHNMKSLKYLKISRVGQNLELNRNNKIIFIEFFYQFRQLQLKEKYLLQFDLAIEFEIEQNERDIACPQYEMEHDVQHGIELFQQRNIKIERFKFHNLNMNNNLCGGISMKHYNHDCAMIDMGKYLHGVFKIRCYVNTHNFNRHHTNMISNIKKDVHPYPTNVKNMKRSVNYLQQMFNEQCSLNPKNLRKYRIENSCRALGYTNNCKRESMSQMSLSHALLKMIITITKTLPAFGVVPVNCKEELPKLHNIGEGISLHSSFLNMALHVDDKTKLEDIKDIKKDFMLFCYTNLIMLIGFAKKNRKIIKTWEKN